MMAGSRFQYQLVVLQDVLVRDGGSISFPTLPGKVPDELRRVGLAAMVYIHTQEARPISGVGPGCCNGSAPR